MSRLAQIFRRPSSEFYAPLIKFLVLAYAFNLFSLITADPDLWGHIKFGEDIWSELSIPKTDPYSYTAFGLPWVNHEWLAEIIFFLIFNLAGSTGLLAFKLGI